MGRESPQAGGGGIFCSKTALVDSLPTIFSRMAREDARPTILGMIDYLPGNLGRGWIGGGAAIFFFSGGKVVTGGSGQSFAAIPGRLPATGTTGGTTGVISDDAVGGFTAASPIFISGNFISPISKLLNEPRLPMESNRIPGICTSGLAGKVS